VTDEALLADQREVARLEGSFICPEGAACFAAVRQLRASGWLSETDDVVVLNTGTGLIYPETMAIHAPRRAKGRPSRRADHGAGQPDSCTG
jgi:threonine synthase